MWLEGGEFQGPPSESNPVLGLYWVVIQYLMKYWLHTTSEYAHTLKLIVYEENRAMFSPHILTYMDCLKHNYATLAMLA